MLYSKSSSASTRIGILIPRAEYDQDGEKLLQILPPAFVLLPNADTSHAKKPCLLPTVSNSATACRLVASKGLTDQVTAGAKVSTVTTKETARGQDLKLMHDRQVVTSRMTVNHSGKGHGSERVLCLVNKRCRGVMTASRVTDIGQSVDMQSKHSEACYRELTQHYA